MFRHVINIFFLYIFRLPVPWLLYGIIYGKPVEVNSVGMVCSIAILFMMLLFVTISIACFHWKMNKGLGFTMFLLYFVFVAVSLMFEYNIIVCPFQCQQTTKIFFYTQSGIICLGIGRARWSGAGPGDPVECSKNIENVTSIHRYMLF